MAIEPAAASGVQVRTGRIDCACDARRSPTLTVFERMIAASLQLESGKCGLCEYPQQFWTQVVMAPVLARCLYFLGREGSPGSVDDDPNEML